MDVMLAVHAAVGRRHEAEDLCSDNCREVPRPGIEQGGPDVLIRKFPPRFGFSGKGTHAVHAVVFDVCLRCG